MQAGMPNCQSYFWALVTLFLASIQMVSAQSNNSAWKAFGSLSHSEVFIREGAIERIGDYATGIAEQVHFLVEGAMPDEDRPKADKTSKVVGT